MFIQSRIDRKRIIDYNKSRRKKMSDFEKIELEQIEKSKTRLEVLGLHKSPVKVNGRRGCNTSKSNSVKRHYSRNIIIENNPASKEFQDYYKKLQEKARAKDRY